LQHYEYGSKTPVPDDPFVQETIATLNKLREDNDALPNGSIRDRVDAIANSDDVNVSIAFKRWKLNSDCYRNGDKVVNWDPWQGLTGDNPDGTTWDLSPLIILGHEFTGHAFNFLISKMTTKWIGGFYEWSEEKFNIQTVEKNLIDHFGNGVERLTHIGGNWYDVPSVSQNFWGGEPNKYQVLRDNPPIQVPYLPYYYYGGLTIPKAGTYTNLNDNPNNNPPNTTPNPTADAANDTEGGGQRNEETADHADAESMKGGAPESGSGDSGASESTTGGGDESSDQSSGSTA
jgi:hypothetical protein